MACPHCRQGALYRITIRKMGIDSYICDECDTVWLKYEQVGPDTGAFADDIIKWPGSTVPDYRAEFTYHEIHAWPNAEP